MGGTKFINTCTALCDQGVRGVTNQGFQASLPTNTRVHNQEITNWWVTVGKTLIVTYIYCFPPNYITPFIHQTSVAW